MLTHELIVTAALALVVVSCARVLVSRAARALRAQLAGDR